MFPGLLEEDDHFEIMGCVMLADFSETVFKMALFGLLAGNHSGSAAHMPL